MKTSELLACHGAMSTLMEEQKLQIEPGIKQGTLPDIHIRISALLTEIALRKPQESEHTARLWRMVLELDSQSAEAYNGIGYYEQSRKNWLEASALFGRAAQLSDTPLAFLNASIAHDQLGNVDDAMVFAKEAIARDPKCVAAYAHLYTLFDQENELDAARQVLLDGLAHSPDSPELLFCTAELDLKQRRYEQGWKNYEHRGTMGTSSFRGTLAQLRSDMDEYPEWTGQPLEGKTIVVMRDQGLGDEIMFARYLPILKAQGATVWLYTYPRAARLLASLACVDAVYTFLPDIPCEFDYWVAMGSLALRANQRLIRFLDDFNELGLSADEKDWKVRDEILTPKRLEFGPFLSSRVVRQIKQSSNLKVGLRWAGNPAQAKERFRGVPFESLNPLLDIPGIDFYSLQDGEAAKQSGDLLVHLAEYGHDVADCAAAINALDLVITVDTMIAHLAGSLGKDVWIMLGQPSDWRWGSGLSGSTPWYPTTRLFRKSVCDVPKQIKAVLRNVVMERGGAAVAREDHDLEVADSNPVPARFIPVGDSYTKDDCIAHGKDYLSGNPVSILRDLVKESGCRVDEVSFTIAENYCAENIGMQFDKVPPVLEHPNASVPPEFRYAQKEPRKIVLCFTADCRYGKMVWRDNDSYVGRSLDLYGEYSEGEVDVFRRLLKPGDTVIEAGANIGAHTVPIAQILGYGNGTNTLGTVYAFEPQKEYCHLLAENAPSNVDITLAALSDYQGEIDVENVELEKTHAPNWYGVDRPNKVSCITIDALDFLALHFLKIDVDGQEHAILRGGEKTIERHRPIIYVEYDKPDCYPDMILWLDERGYRVYKHAARMFNLQNFRGNAVNVFGGLGSTMLLCIPKERADLRFDTLGLPLDRMKVRR